MLLKYGLLLVAYLLGAIPFSVILGRKYKGIDVREHGSGNPGGTNSLRFLGRKVGLWVLFLDGAKAALIILLIKFQILDGSQLLHPLAYGLASAVGHVYSVYIKFKGGKAVAATVGTFIAFDLLYAVIMMFMFFGSLKIWKYVSISSSVAGLSSVVISLAVGDFESAIFCALFSLLIIFRHRKNYQNIYNHVEPKVSWI